ncbi:dephospho-CoA kinase [Subtercola boreus]|uniref:Dephospho-CoA kinase n=1 Tax=Subtercola boreus TaxID=120213 RepID=A0A3E0WD33_9MICO|nr:dephospho-CoA kinase [Subtercola boreus]RFA21265.1 dephospho-CoA kinase [Subtercola boreus]RFA21648.1 dephospho-CoA kinase [Subtercola boreus]RFA27618.1 dephospho-CoA kinase [Subtercola boreus]
MHLVALTGGIASGKSTVAARLAELGAVIIDADRLAREVVEPGTDALRHIAEAFGQEVLQPDGSLDRPALGSRVFGQPQNLQKLNDITHPAVHQLGLERIAAAEAADPDAIVVYDVPLLLEASRRPYDFELAIVVSAAEETRVRRLVEIRGMTEADARSRIASQASEAERLAIADVVIDSNGTLGQTLDQVGELWTTLTALPGTAAEAAAASGTD